MSLKGTINARGGLAAYRGLLTQRIIDFVQILRWFSQSICSQNMSRNLYKDR